MQLEDEQLELLAKFVEAHRNSPKESRGSFSAVVTQNEPQATFLHSRVPNLAFKGSVSDADVLAELGHLRKSSGSHGQAVFTVLPQGIDAYEKKDRRLADNSIRNSGAQRQSATGISEQSPAAINESLERFKRDHPDPRKVAFLIMRFGSTKAHDNIVAGVRKALEPFGVAAIRADDKEYHEDLFSNVLTYIYGCGFGVAIFERIETEDFNPNVALEVGYMFALRKPVCLLKDRTLKTLHTDLAGKLYRAFDALDPIETIPHELGRWLRDKGLPEGGERQEANRSELTGVEAIVIELQRDALNSTELVSDLLRKALIVARKVGDEDFCRWIELELKGYSDDSPKPEYRWARGRVEYYHPNGDVLPVVFEDADVQAASQKRFVGQPIGQIEQLVLHGGKDSLYTIPLAGDLEAKLMRAAALDSPPIWRSGREQLFGMVDTVRNLILDWCLKLGKDR
jgi:nucleoside 2-deoxyribosyltransferase